MTSYIKKLKIPILILLFVFLIPFVDVRAGFSIEGDTAVDEMCKNAAQYECMSTTETRVTAGGEVITTRTAQECINDHVFNSCKMIMNDYDFVTAVSNQEDIFCSNLEKDLKGRMDPAQRKIRVNDSYLYNVPIL